MDSAASSLKSDAVIRVQVDFLQKNYANSGRGICARANVVDEMVNRVRNSVRDFIGATTTDQIIFTNGTTDGMNQIARMIPDDFVVMVSDLDHHSARLPFENRFKTIVCPLDDEYNLDVSDLVSADVFVITAMSNVLGAAQDVKKIIHAARAINPNIITVVDAAQYVAHLPIDVSDCDCDFLCFSGHKMGGDTGVGIMYIKNPDIWSPDKFGGGMIKKVISNIIFEDSPAKFEAGTLPLTQIAGLGVALNECTEHRAQSTDIVRYLYNKLSKIEKIKIFTRPDSAMITFIVDGMHVLDFGALMGAHNVCLRVGNMCASWIHWKLGIDATIRLSPGFYNTMDEAAQVVDIIKKIVNKK
jgi:cysteine desulfurase/selenocysteine lyase